MRAPTSPVTTMISSMSIVYNIVGHGRPAVSRRSKRRSGVVIALCHMSVIHSCLSVSGAGHPPVNVSNVKDLTVLAMHKRVGSEPFHLNGSPTQVRAHAEIGNGGNHGDGGGDVVEDAVGARFRGRKSDETKGRGAHYSGCSLIAM